MNKDFKTLQLFYSAALSDAAFHYGEHRIFDDVTEKKRISQNYMAETQLRNLNISSLEELYQRFSEIFGCAEWNTDTEGDSVAAESASCMLCGIARKQGAPQPCRPFCINPFTSYAQALGYSLDVKETLWDGERCLFVSRKRSEDREG